MSNVFNFPKLLFFLYFDAHKIDSINQIQLFKTREFLVCYSLGVLGKSCILPPGSVGGYPSPEEPPTPETSEDTLRREMLMLTTRLVVRSVCRD